MLPARYSTYPRTVASVWVASAASVLGSILLAGIQGCKESPESDVGQRTPFPEERQINKDAFTSARVCGACHQAIHAFWQRSLHAQSFNNAVFQAAYRTASRAHSEGETRVCLTCHAPVVRATPEQTPQSPLVQEGITCDFCHSVSAVRLETSAVQVDLDVGRAKYGPLRHGRSPAHEVVESSLHRRSEFCAPCHEYRNEHGVAVLETYSEWKVGPYATMGKECQDCHMPLVPEQVSAMGLKRAELNGVNLHDISGSHNLETVRKAVTMKIADAGLRPDNSLQMTVIVSNVGSGHCFPTGLPLHRAILEVTLTRGQRQVGHQTIEFQKQLLDKNGLPVSREFEAFLDARKVSLDTRLKPKEDRSIGLTFPDVDATNCVVEASLWYQYTTQAIVIKDKVEIIEPIEMKFLVASQKHRLPSAGD